MKLNSISAPKLIPSFSIGNSMPGIIMLGNFIYLFNLSKNFYNLSLISSKNEGGSAYSNIVRVAFDSEKNNIKAARLSLILDFFVEIRTEFLYSKYR